MEQCFHHSKIQLDHIHIHNCNPIILKHTNLFTVFPISTEITPYMKTSECYSLLNKNLKRNYNNKYEKLSFIYFMYI